MKLQLIIEAENCDDIDGLKTILTNVQASMIDVKAPGKDPQMERESAIKAPDHPNPNVLPVSESPGLTAAPTIEAAVELPPLNEVTANDPAPAVDGAGVPWSADFHAGTKTKKADGTWKAIKGQDKEAAKAYEAQFKTAVADTPAEASPIGLPGALPLEQSALEKLTTRLHNIAKSGVPCAHLDWTADSPTWKDMSTADAINALLKASNLSQGFIDLDKQNEDVIATIDMRVSLAWPTL